MVVGLGTIVPHMTSGKTGNGGPGRQDKGGSAASKNGPGTKNTGWAGKAPPKGKGPGNK